MAVNIKSEFNTLINKLNSHYKNRLRLGISGYSQLFFYSFLFCYPSFSYAGPVKLGAGIVGGPSAGNINTQGLTTNINQLNQSLIINWQSFDVNANETVNFNQPNTSAIALNRIGGSSASQIFGQVNANGNIILMNNHGVFFSPTASVNVGGIIATSLNITDTNFLNQDYIFNEVLGTDGAIVNSGLINASTGGVALLGKQVKNEGVISAQLGSVTLAAGKAAVLTFDQQGLLGVRVTEAVLQDELGIDPAVLNSGEIIAEGGRVLLTASVSQDVFSQAVNSGDIEQATSVVVNADGSFTLGAGADVVNTGVVDVSTSNTNAGQVVLLGENVTSSGTIKADSVNADGGNIELHAKDTALLTENSLTSSRAENSGEGGVVKVLGERVGLFDQSIVDVSGALGGGQALIGGDFQGKNHAIRNATATYVSSDSQLFADALTTGNGGKLITWADNSTWFYGSAFSRGGELSGDGGLVEVSGKVYLKFRGDVNTRAINGEMGTLLLDPTDLVIKQGSSDGDGDGSSVLFGSNTTIGTVLSGESVSTLYETELEGISSGTSIILQAEDNITIEDLASDSGDGIGSTFDGTLNLQQNGKNIGDAGSVVFIADADGDGVGAFSMDVKTNTIQTNGGAVEIEGASVDIGNINTTPTTADNDGGEIKITASLGDGSGTGAVTNATSTISVGALTTSAGPVSSDNDGSDAGNITLLSPGTITVAGNIIADGSDARRNNNNNQNKGGNGGVLTVTSSTGSISVQGVSLDGGDAAGDSGDHEDGGDAGNLIFNATAGDISVGVVSAIGGRGWRNTLGAADQERGGDAGTIGFNATDITLNGSITSQGGVLRSSSTTVVSGGDGIAGDVTFTGNVILGNGITVTTSGRTSGTNTGHITFTGDVNSDTSGTYDLTLTTDADNVDIDGAMGTLEDGSNVNTGRLGDFKITSASAITLGTAAGSGGVIAKSVIVEESNSFTTNDFAITTTGAADTAGGVVNVASTGAITVGAITTDGGAASADTNGFAGGDINLNSSGNNITFNGELSARGSKGGALSSASSTNGGNAGKVDITASSGLVTIGGNIISKGGDGVDGGANGTAGFNNSIILNSQDILVGTSAARVVEGGSVVIAPTNSFSLLNSLTLTAENANPLITSLANDVVVNQFVDFDGIAASGTDRKLTINANENILVTTIGDSSTASADQLEVILNANTGQIEIFSTINTGGSNFTAKAEDFFGWFSTTNFNTRGIFGNIDANGGDIKIDSVGHVLSRNNITTSLTGKIDLTVTNGYFGNDYDNGQISSGSGAVTILTNGISNGHGAWLGDITTISGNLIVTTTAGDIFQDTSPVARTLTIGGTTALDSDTFNITLTNSTNNFTGAVSVTSSGAASIVDINSIELGNSNITGTGSLDITALNGGISQFAGSTLAVNGITNFTNTNGDIIVNNTGNDFVGVVNVSNSGGSAATEITIRDDNSFAMGTTSLSGGTYTVNAVTDTGINSDITLTNDVVASADSTLILNANNDINIDADQTADAGTLTLNFNSDIDTNGGQININAASIDSNNGAITFNGSTVLEKSTAIDAGIAKIDFTGTVDGTTARTETLTLTAGDLDFDANVGATTRTGSIDITASGAINAVNASITANALTVNANNTSFTSGNINTQGDEAYALNDDKDGFALAGNSGAVVINSDGAINIANIITTGGEASINQPGYSGGDVTLITTDQINVTSISSQGGSRNISLTDTQGFNGGNISLAATDIVIGAIASNGTNAIGSGVNNGGSAGTVSITATDDTVSGTPTITLDGDIDTASGTATGGGTVAPTVISQLSLVGSSSPSGTVTINYSDDFTSEINIIGSSGVDTLISTDRSLAATPDENAWIIDPNNGNSLNGNVSFSSFENLTGGNAVTDTFTVAAGGTISGLINGGTNSNNSYIDVLNLPAVATTVQLNDPAAIAGTNATVGVLEVNNIEQINGGAVAGNELLSRIDIDANWFIDATGAGRVGDNSLAATDTALAEGTTAFSNFDTLTGSDSNADRFEVLSNTVTGMTLTGGAFATDLTDNTKYDTLTGPDISGVPLNTRWTLTADNNGTLTDEPASALSITFDGIENLTSGSGDDVFDFGTFNVSGSVDAGAGTNDSIDLSQNTAAFTFDVSGGVNGNGRTNFEQVIGNGISTLSAGTSTAIYTWSVTAENAGSVLDDSGNDLVFSGFINLTGGAAADTFNIYDNTGVDDATRGNVTGLINGGTGTNILNIYTAGLITGGTGKAVTVQLEGASNTTNGFLDVISIGEINASTNIAFNSTLLAGSSGTNSWDITGDRAGTVSNTVTNASFTGFTTLTGADNVVDEFTITQTALPNEMTLSGGASADASEFDTLTGANIASTFTISDEDTGNISDTAGTGTFAISFDGIETLTGNLANDSFVITNTTTNGSLRGSIDGGAGGDNSLTSGALTGGNEWEITGDYAGNLNTTASFTGINRQIGNNSVNDKFIIYDAVTTADINGGTSGSNTLELFTDTGPADTASNINAWNVSGADAGTVKTDTNKTVSFVAVSNLVGNDGTDNFTLTTELFAGNLNGGTGSNTLTAADAVNDWSIRTTDSTLTSTATLTFNGMETLTGGSLGDTFTFFDSTSTFAGLIDGGNDAGVIDRLDVSQLSNKSVSLDVAVVADVRSTNIEEIDGNVDGSNSLLAANTENKWIIDAQNAGAVGALATFTGDVVPTTSVQGLTKFTNFGTLTGGTLSDQFIITTNNITTAMTFNGGSSAGLTQYDTLTLGNATTAFAANTFWDISDTDSGVLTSTNLAVNFNGIENLTGGEGDDQFTFTETATTGSLRGLIDGSTNPTVNPGDKVDYSLLSNTITYDIVASAAEATNASVDFIYIKNIETIGVNDGVFNGSSTGTNTWYIESVDSGYLINSGQRINFTNATTLNGQGTSNDDFIITVDNVFNGMLNGGAGSDTITAFETSIVGGNVWDNIDANVTSGLDGNLNTNTSFTSIETLYGSATNDTFNLIGSALSGTIFGYNAAYPANPLSPVADTGTDRISAAGVTANITWDLANNINDGSYNTNLSYNGIENISGSTTNQDTINAPAGNNAWNITSNGTGDLNNLTLLFGEMDIYNGNINNDVFVLSSLVTTGTYNGLKPLLTGDVGTDTITSGAVAAGNIWNITQNFDGNINTTITFTGMDKLIANITNDRFILADVVTTSLIEGSSGAGTDSIELATETDATTNNWNITGAGQGTLKGTIQFSLIEGLVGNDGTDQFALSTDQFAGTINGGDGIDSLTASTGNNTWLIDAADGGSLTDDTSNIGLGYSFVENLVGSAANDLFYVRAAGNVSGLIDGGSGIDTVDFIPVTSPKVTSITVKLGATDTTPTSLEFFNTNSIETIKAPTVTDPVTTVSNTLLGADVKQLWIIDGLNRGAVGDASMFNPGIPTGDNEGVVKFTNFDRVIGGSNDDAFRFVDNNSKIASLLDGGAHSLNGGDTIDLSIQDKVTVTVSTINGFDGIEGYTGNGYNSTLTANDTNNLWTITGQNNGTVLDQDGSLPAFTFEGFNILVGGNDYVNPNNNQVTAKVDTFVVNAGGFIEATKVVNDPDTGLIVKSGVFGSGGDDTLTINLDGSASNGSIFFDGGTGLNTISFESAANSSNFDVAIFTPDAATGVINYDFVNNANAINFSVDYVDANVDTVIDNVNASKLIVNGTTSNDTINFDSTTFSVIENVTPTTFTEVTYSNKNGIDIIAGNGTSDVINLGGDVNFTNDVLLSAETISSAGFTTTATTLTLDTVQLTTSPMLTNIDNLAIINSDAVNAANNINIQEADSVAITDLELNGTLTLVADTNITQSTTVLNSAALLNLSAANGSIDLSTSTNVLSGRLNLSAVNGSIDVVNSGDTNLGDINTNNALTLVTSGTITDSGTIAANSASFDAGSSAITLDADTNDFGAFSVANASSVVVHDATAIQLGNINIGTGVFTLSAGLAGDTSASGVTQMGGTSFNQAKPSAGLAGAVTFNAGGGVITLNRNNDFNGAVSLNDTGANNVSINDANDIVFGATNIGTGTFTVTATDGVSQINAITQDVNASLVSISTSAGVIDLKNELNSFTGQISLTNIGVGAVALTNSNDIVLLNSSVGGTFDIKSKGATGISQINALFITGNAAFFSNANTSISLDNPLNNFQSGVSFSSNSSTSLMDVTIANSSSLDLGNIIVSNNLDVIAGDAITNDSGSLVVGGVAWFDASGNNVRLNDQANNFNDIVFVNAATVDVTDIDNINVGSSVAGRENSSILADLNITSLNGNITDETGSALSVGGLTSLTAGSLASATNVELNETANEFNQVNIINAQNVTLVEADTDANGLDIRSGLIAGNLDVTSTGNITNSDNALMSGALVVNGTASFTTANAGTIQLINSSNALASALTFSAATAGVALDNVEIVNTLATNINELNITTDLSITSGGAISQNAAFTVGNLTTLDAINTSTFVPQDIVLESANNMNLITILNANNVTIKNATNALAIDQLNAAGAIDIMSGALSIADDISATSVALDSGAGLTTVESITTPGLLTIASEGLMVNGSITAQNFDINSGGAAAVFTNDITTDGAIDNQLVSTGLTLNGLLNADSNTVLDATSGVANLNRDIALTTGDLTVNGAGINQAGNINVLNDVTFNSTQGIAMTTPTTSTTVTDGSIQYNADGTVSVGLLSAVNGTAGVSTSANIVDANDANGEEVNFLALNMMTRTGAGMGSESNRIETQVSTMDVINSGSGSVWIDQAGAGDLEIIALQNDTVRTFAGDPGGKTNIRTDEDFLINPNSIIVDRDTGILFMVSTTGSFVGTGSFISGIDPVATPDGSLINQDITANQATFFGLNGDFGSSFRPIVFDVPESKNSIPGETSFIFIDTRRVAARYYPEEPLNLTTTGVDVSALGVLNAIAGELLVEIESLGDIDPAIFTDLQNYSLQDISIRMPRDQLFEDELEEDAKLQ